MMSQSERLTDDENATMRILWDRGGASVSELAMATRQPADTTLAVLHGLRRKGAVERQQAGRNIVYRPCLNRETARTHALGRLLCGEEAGGENGLGVVVLRESDVDAKDWADLQAEIAQRRKA